MRPRPWCSPQSKALVLTSFSNFVGHAIATLERKDDDENRNSMPTWFMASSFSSKEANDDFRALLRTSRFDSSTTLLLGLSETHGYYHGAYPFHDISNEQKLGDLDMSDIHSDISALMQKQSSEGSLDSAALHLILVSLMLHMLCIHVNLFLLQSLTTTVHPVLVSTFLDCAPSVFSPTQTNPESETQTVQALMRIAQYLYGHLLRTAKVSFASINNDIDFLHVYVLGLSTSSEASCRSEGSYLAYIDILSLRRK